MDIFIIGLMNMITFIDKLELLNHTNDGGFVKGFIANEQTWQTIRSGLISDMLKGFSITSMENLCFHV